MDSDKITEVVVLGGGDAGLLAALCLRQLNPSLSITVVDNFEESTPDVGKSTYAEIMNILHDFLDINESEFIAEVKPVWKGSVYFRDWCGYPRFHYAFDEILKYPSTKTPESIVPYYFQYEEVYRTEKYFTYGEQIVEQRKTPFYFDEQGDVSRYESVAYHLDINRFSSYLRELCRARNVELIDDTVVDVDTDGRYVEQLRGEETTHTADLFVDASGFSQVIVEQLNTEFVEFDIPLDSAVKTRVDRPLDEVIPATVIDSGECGWFWNIDTFEYRDMGYVYASDFISDEKARDEFESYCADQFAPAHMKTYEFTSGYVSTPWIGNCVAIGNASGFVEPLQSTGLTASAEGAQTLSSLLAGHAGINDPSIKEAYNQWFRNKWESIYDFICVHYLYSSGENAFWRSMRSLPKSDRVAFIIEEFDDNGLYIQRNPIDCTEEIANLSVFNMSDFYSIMRNMGATSEFYEGIDVDVPTNVRQNFDQYYSDMRDTVNDYLTIEELYDVFAQYEEQEGSVGSS